MPLKLLVLVPVLALGPALAPAPALEPLHRRKVVDMCAPLLNATPLCHRVSLDVDFTKTFVTHVCVNVSMA